MLKKIKAYVKYLSTDKCPECKSTELKILNISKHEDDNSVYNHPLYSSNPLASNSSYYKYTTKYLCKQCGYEFIK